MKVVNLSGEKKCMTLAEMRELARRTMKEVADGIGVTERTWWSWENSKTNPSVKNQRAIAEYFHVEYENIQWPTVNTKSKD